MKISKKKNENENDNEKNKILEKRYNYKNENMAGNGTFGVVYKAEDKETNQFVAIKKVFQDPRYKNRELEIIKELNHPNCVKLLNYYYSEKSKSAEEGVDLNLVMDFVPETLYRVSRYYRKQKEYFPNILVKLYSYQMLRSLNYIHIMGICHRDIKPQNLLVDPFNHVLKLCDFGSAKKLVKGEPNIAYICSRYYRAPELIFGATEYTNSIDVWSTGCVIAELLLNEPIFPGESSIDQLVEIIKVLGTPNFDQIKAMNSNYKEINLPNIRAQPLSRIFKSKIDPLAIDLVSKLLVYSPKERLTPLEALDHPFFSDLKNENFKINNKNPPELFNFTREELSPKPELEDKLIPNWFKKNWK